MVHSVTVDKKKGITEADKELTKREQLESVITTCLEKQLRLESKKQIEEMQNRAKENIESGMFRSGGSSRLSIYDWLRGNMHTKSCFGSLKILC